MNNHQYELIEESILDTYKSIGYLFLGEEWQAGDADRRNPEKGRRRGRGPAPSFGRAELRGKGGGSKGPGGTGRRGSDKPVDLEALANAIKKLSLKPQRWRPPTTRGGRGEIG